MPKIRRILSIDGGGIRGILPATILSSIEARTGKPISQLFDLIAGTSTGGILTLGLTKPNASGQPEFTAQQLCQIYEKEVPNIFRDPQSWWGNLLNTKYGSSPFQQVLNRCFGDCRLKGALTDVVIPCYDIQRRSPYLFKSSMAKLQSDCDFHMKDIALATSASPTLFRPVRIPRFGTGPSKHLVDGGVFANNPAILALSECKTMYPGPDESYFIVSIGTGKSTRPLTQQSFSQWGYVGWSRPMLELVMESISESVHQQLDGLLPPAADRSYYRLQIDLPKQINHAIDDASLANMQALRHIAHDFCSHTHSGHELSKLSDTLLRLSELPAEAPLLAR